VILHEVLEAERTCPCGAPMVKMGQQVSEQTGIVPMQICLLQPVRYTYGYPVSECAPVTAAAVAQKQR